MSLPGAGPYSLAVCHGTTPYLPPGLAWPTLLVMAEQADGIVVQGVSKTYMTARGPVLGLAPVDLYVPRGRFVTLVGPSGCGKSTLLKLIAGIEKADQGQIRLFGEDIAQAKRAKQIGFVPQALALLPWRTVIDNVRLPLQLNRAGGPATSKGEQEAAEVLSALGLGDALHRYPSQLSGGMRQRVAIARAFVHEPAVLLMDEPFSAVDELTSEVLRRELLDLWQSAGTTVIFVSHSLAEAVLLSDEVVVMLSGAGSQPAHIEVDLVRPRGDLVEVSEEFRQVERRVRLALRGGAAGPAKAP